MPHAALTTALAAPNRGAYVPATPADLVALCEPLAASDPVAAKLLRTARKAKPEARIDVPAATAERLLSLVPPAPAEPDDEAPTDGTP